MQKLLVTDFQKLFDPYYKYLITAILIVVPLFPKFPAFKVSGTYVAIRLEDFLIFGTLLIFLIPLILFSSTFLTCFDKSAALSDVKIKLTEVFNYSPIIFSRGDDLEHAFLKY